MFLQFDPLSNIVFFCNCLEDNDAVIHMCIKARAPKLLHLARTLRIDLDCLFERFMSDLALSVTYLNAKLQLADLFTKANFTSMQWLALLTLNFVEVHTPNNRNRSPLSRLIFQTLKLSNVKGI